MSERSIHYRLAAWIQKHHLLVLLLTVVSSAYCFRYVRALPLSTDLASLLPDYYTSVRNYRAVMEKVQGDRDLIVVLEHPDDPGLKVRVYHKMSDQRSFRA